MILGDASGIGGSYCTFFAMQWFTVRPNGTETVILGQDSAWLWRESKGAVSLNYTCRESRLALRGLSSVEMIFRYLA